MDVPLLPRTAVSPWRFVLAAALSVGALRMLAQTFVEGPNGVKLRSCAESLFKRRLFMKICTFKRCQGL